MAYSPAATRAHRRRQREGKLWLRIEVDEADLVATLLRKDNAMPAGAMTVVRERTSRMFNLIDEIETTSRAQIHERTHPFDAEIEETVLAAAALVLTRRLAGSPSDTECRDLLDRLERYRRSQLGASFALCPGCGLPIQQGHCPDKNCQGA